MVARVGSQIPRIWSKPKGATSFEDGHEAIELAGSYGLILDEFQQGFVLNSLSRRKGGLLAAGIAGESIPRQNGKNGEIEAVQLHKMVMQGRRILHTAHEVKTAKKHFNRLRSYFENERKYPELARLVLEIRKTNGQEAIILHQDDCPAVMSKALGRCGCDPESCPGCDFSARSRGSARGFTADDLFCDEAQELTDEQLEALLPTISAARSGDPQQFYLGTPPSQVMLAEVWRRIRADGVKGKDPRLLWREWSIPDDMDPHEATKSAVDLAYATNPALGIRINLQTILDELRSMSAEGFCRERLGQWLSQEQAGPFPPGTWLAGVDATSQIVESSPLVFAVEVSVNRSKSHVVVAGLRADGLPHVEVVASRAGVDWVPGWFEQRAASYGAMTVVVQKNGAPASGLVPDLRAIDGINVHEWAGGELGAWTARFFDLVAASTVDPRAGVAHLPQPVLDVAASHAVIVYLAGGAPMVDRKRGSVDVTPLVGAIGSVGKLLERAEATRVSAYEFGSFVAV